MALAENQKRYLRKLGHGLKPVVLVGQAGLSAGVIAEADAALTHHELLKLRISAPDRSSRQRMIASLCAANDADLIQTIGHVALIYRRNKDKPRLILPAPTRPGTRRSGLSKP